MVLDSHREDAESAERRGTETGMAELAINELSEKTIGAAIEVHRALGPGLLESAYEECLCRELSIQQIDFQRQYALPVEYKGVKLGCGYVIDIFVEERLILELKAVGKVTDLHKAQLMTYMKLSDCKLGLLINFNVSRLVDGINRLSLGAPNL